MATIPQRELRNNVSDVLRRAQEGERFTITVDGRPVAELGPLPGTPAGQSVEALWRILADTPVDDRWTDDQQTMRDEDAAAARDVWAE